jgi:hypothetical protein
MYRPNCLSIGVWMTKPLEGYATKPPLKCTICGEPILPTDFNVTEDGKPVHGDCWLARVKDRKLQQD